MKRLDVMEVANGFNKTLIFRLGQSVLYRALYQAMGITITIESQHPLASSFKFSHNSTLYSITRQPFAGGSRTTVKVGSTSIHSINWQSNNNMAIARCDIGLQIGGRSYKLKGTTSSSTTYDFKVEDEKKQGTLAAIIKSSVFANQRRHEIEVHPNANIGDIVAIQSCIYYVYVQK